MEAFCETIFGIAAALFIVLAVGYTSNNIGPVESMQLRELKPPGFDGV